MTDPSFPSSLQPATHMGLGKSISTDAITSANHLKLEWDQRHVLQCQYGICLLQDRRVSIDSQGEVQYYKLSVDQGNPDGHFQYWLWTRVFEAFYRFKIEKRCRSPNEKAFR
jgi:hypothetical protein